MKAWLERKRHALEHRMAAMAEDESGFTLIEMSIVLVIIGLIIGGVLKGQELINSTRLKATVSQWDATKAAVNGFQDKYNSVPGDYNDANVTISANGVLQGGTTGLGNGTVGTLLTDANAFNNDISGATTENLNAWAHLGAAGLVAGITVCTTANTLQAAASGGVMTGKISGTSWAILHGTVNSSTSLWSRLQFGTGSPTASLSGKDAAEIDRKVDDNNAIRGSIQSYPQGATNVSTGCSADTTGAYSALSTTRACTTIFNLQ
ncbi:MAG: prepilin-type N-terminal cleavage/methylation domain-containing protein [Rhodospirillales bacterium]|nr:prepilin-type N-terminal cleavage/methylation domain-containing protein [Rhodospirillales bacterium]